MAYQTKISDRAKKDLSKIDKKTAFRITRFLAERVTRLDHPRQIGEPLAGSELGNYWKYRVGDYRIICEIQDQKMLVIAIRIGHRRAVYR